MAAGPAMLVGGVRAGALRAGALHGGAFFAGGACCVNSSYEDAAVRWSGAADGGPVDESSLMGACSSRADATGDGGSPGPVDDDAPAALGSLNSRRNVSEVSAHGSASMSR